MAFCLFCFVCGLFVVRVLFQMYFISYVLCFLSGCVVRVLCVVCFVSALFSVFVCLVLNLYISVF